jgi:hypothetical protein
MLISAPILFYPAPNLDKNTTLRNYFPLRLRNGGGGPRCNLGSAFAVRNIKKEDQDLVAQLLPIGLLRSLPQVLEELACPPMAVLLRKPIILCLVYPCHSVARALVYWLLPAYYLLAGLPKSEPGSTTLTQVVMMVHVYMAARASQSALHH